MRRLVGLYVGCLALAALLALAQFTLFMGELKNSELAGLMPPFFHGGIVLLAILRLGVAASFETAILRSIRRSRSVPKWTSAMLAPVVLFLLLSIFVIRIGFDVLNEFEHARGTVVVSWAGILLLVTMLALDLKFINKYNGRFPSERSRHE